MAAIAVSNIIELNYNFGRRSIDGFPIAVYRILGAFAAADTATIAPNRFDLIKSVIGAPGVTDLPSTGAGVTSVIITMRSSAASGQVVDIILEGEQRN